MPYSNKPKHKCSLEGCNNQCWGVICNPCHHKGASFARICRICGKSCFGRRCMACVQNPDGNRKTRACTVCGVKCFGYKCLKCTKKKHGTKIGQLFRQRKKQGLC